MILNTIHQAALQAPDKLAIAFYPNHSATPHSLTRGQLWDNVAEAGTAISKIFAPESRLLLVFPQGIEFHVCLLACQYAGCVPVPVPLPNSGGGGGRERLINIVSDNECAGALTLEQHYEDIAFLEDGSANGIRPTPLTTFESLQSSFAGEVQPPYPAADTDLAFIQYTSGSVGTPKGVVVTHANLHANVRMMAQGRDNKATRMCSWVPHYHDMGLIGNFYEAMHVHGEFHLTPAETFVRRPLSWLRLLSRTKATHTTVPHFALTLCSRLAHTLKPGEIDLSHMRLLVNSSEPVEWEGLLEFETAFAPFGLASGTVVPHYGLAECTVMVSYPAADRPRYLDVDREAFASGFIQAPINDANRKRVVNCGRGALDCEYRIVDPQTKRPLADGRVGEVWITGSHVAQGYWGREGETAETFRQTLEKDTRQLEYVRSGDLGFVHDDDLFVTGRMKDVIIIRGQNYYARDIELLAEQASPLVRTGRVVAIPLRHKGQETVGLLAEVTAKFDYRVDASDFVSAFTSLLSQKSGLSVFAIALVRRNSLPRTTSGKIRRRDAADLYHTGQLSSVFEYEATRFASSAIDMPPFPGLKDRSAVLDWLEARVLEQTDLSAIAPDQDLFALGLDSLSMTNLFVEIEEATGASLLQERFYASPTLMTLVTILAENAEQNHSDKQQESDPQTASTHTTEQASKAKRGWKKTLASRLREYGPTLGPVALPYGLGSRLLDQFIEAPSLRNRLARPFAKELDALIAEQKIENAEQIQREVTRAIAWTIWRETALGDPDTFAKYATINGMEHVREARAAGKSIILALVTTRMKGLYKYIAELTDKPFGAIANIAPSRAEFYGLGPLAHHTGAKLSKTVASARVAQIHNAHKILEQGGTVGIFMDSFEGTGGIAVPMLGRKRPVRPGIAELALDTGAVIIPVGQSLHDEGRITFKFKAPFTPAGETRADQILSLMVQQASALDEMWRANPGQMSEEAIRRQLKLPKV